MKKIHLLPYSLSVGWKKTLLIMRISLVLLTVCLLQINATVYSQKTKFDFSINNLPLRDVLKEIENKSDFRFFFSDNLMLLDKNVQLNAANMNVEQILDKLLAGSEYSYKVMDNNLVIIAPSYVTKQANKVTGIITDASNNNEPLPGVNVIVEGTTLGTVTDIDGKYSIEVPNANSVLVFSFVGYNTEKIAVAGKATVDVSLVADITALDAVIVVGYGTAKKSDLTGAVASANIKDFEKSPNTNLVQSLQGTVPGLNIGQTTSAGGTPDILIRGKNTISGSSSVLIVLDGIIYNNSLSSINPADIESVDILKDASSTAVYGARAANGVVCITTKKGKAGKAKISYSSSYSIQNPTKDLHPMNRAELLDFVKENMWDKAYTAESGYTVPNSSFNLITWMPDSYMVKDGEIVSTDYNWWDACTRTGSILENKLSITGGTEAVSYLVSLGNVTQKNLLLNDDFKRNSVRVNLDANIRPWWKLGAQVSGSFVNQDGAEPTLWTLITMSPLATPYNADGTLNRSPMNVARDNPLLGSVVDDKERHNYFIGNMYSEFKLPIKGLTYRLNFGNNYQINEHDQASMYGNGGLGEAYKQNSSYYDYTLDNIVNYTKEFGMHNIGATLVYGAYERKYSYTEAKSNTFSRLPLGYNGLEQGTNQFTNSDAWSEAMLYQMARLNYKFHNRYLITATLRRDGYSGFAKNFKSATFPSVALAWVISDESFFKVPWVEQLKLRGGYGISGNQVDRYSSLTKVSTGAGYIFGDGGTTVMKEELYSMSNNDLKWEKTKGINFGLDFTLLKTRLNGSLEVYKTTTRDLLYDVSIPTITGFSSIRSNVGEIQNKGIEFSITSRNIVNKDFEWSTTFNISSNANKIVSLTGKDNDGDGKEDDLIASNLFIGESLSAIYDYKTDGIYQVGDVIPTGYHEGNYKLVDTNDDGSITTADKVIVGKTDPAYRLGIMNKFSYKDFSFSFFINSVQGGKDGYLGQNMSTVTQDDNSRRYNMMSERADLFWSPNNTDGIYSRYKDAPALSPTSVYEDRSFIRLQDVTFSYNLPKSLLSSLHIENVNFYVTGKNLFIITKWHGWDPEANYGTTTYGSKTINNGGSNYDGRPVMKSYTAGINVTF
jgi:TonB-dependent starch-binding outer membrane protein SusC